jgi:hypothetical protein
VHIVLSIPGRDLAVSREPHHAKDRYANADVYTLDPASFSCGGASVAIVQDPPAAGCDKPQRLSIGGEVAQVLSDADHGFILNNVGSQLYFHRDSVTNGDFRQ